MKGNHMVAALNTENRQLRATLQAMRAEQQQGQFLEELTCAALTGYTMRGDLTPDQAAKLSVEAAECVLNRIISEVRKAQATEDAGDGSAEPAAEPEAVDESKSALILEP